MTETTETKSAIGMSDGVLTLGLEALVVDEH